MNDETLFSQLELPNGIILKNRLCKAAMEENLAAEGQVPDERLERLYRGWADGGVGLILTGNVMISPSAVTGPGAVILERGTDLTPFRKWAAAGKANGAQFWMQINHPGRQLYASMDEQAVAPSAVAVDVGRFSNMLAQPRELSEAEIRGLIDRFAETAALAEEAGFTGVQLHAAHGYLISQFLSPLVNKRTDQWGGSLENRARFLFEAIKAIRSVVSSDFSVAVKLNSADFQKGGFQVEDAMEVTRVLNDLGLDLLELSGGSYESPAMYGQASETSSSRREAFFVDFARQVAHVARMPIMVTGGIYRKSTAIEALEKDEAGFGVSVLGIAKAFTQVPDLPNRWQNGKTLDVEMPILSWKNKTLAGLAASASARRRLVRLGYGKSVERRLSPHFSLVWDRLRMRRLTKRYRRWRECS